MSFSKLKGQSEIKKRLAAQFTATPAHAMMFTGPRGIGKHSFSRESAKALLCSNPSADGACDHCNNCTYFDAGTHPDFISVEAEAGKKNIRVEDIRSKIISDIVVCPQISKRKVFFIDCDYLNEEGQNALLKSLEEPPEHVAFVMSCTDPSIILPTVLSRTVMFKLTDYSNEEIVSALSELSVKNLNDDEKKFYAAFSGGIIGKALQLSCDDDFSESRDKLFDMMLKLPELNYTNLLKNYSFFEANKDVINEMLQIMLWVLGDLAVLLKQPEHQNIKNSDKMKQLKEFLKKHPYMTIDRIGKSTSAINSLGGVLKLNINFEMAVCNMLLKIKKEFTL